jgi:hypothetical protein
LEGSGPELAVGKTRKEETAVSQQAVERALGKLLTDENFRDRFFANPEMATWEAGLTLSSVELAALSRLSPEALTRFSDHLDKRISRPSLDPDRREAGTAERP